MSISVNEAVDILAQQLLLKEYGVAGVGHDSIDRGDAIRVYLKTQEAADRIPDILLGYPVKKIVSGPFMALSTMLKPSYKVGKTARGLTGAKTGKWRPCPGGVSIGHKAVSAGTLCSRVVDKTTGKRLILSNNHVLANTNAALRGDEILQPGYADGGRVETDTIAYLERFVTISSNVDNLVDCAVAVPAKDGDLADEVLDLGVITDIEEAKVGMAIAKSGRTTCYKEDTIADINATLQVCYDELCTKVFTFRDQIVTSGPLAEGGDSGSCVINKATKKAVGLLFAGSHDDYGNPIYAVLNKMTNVCNLLNIKFGSSKPKPPDYLPWMLFGVGIFGTVTAVASSI